MSKSPLGLALTLPVVLLALFSAPWASAEDPAAAAREPHALGDHPAVVVQRLQRSAGYDYAAKFYPHPAWLYLSSQPPHAADQATNAAEAGRVRSPVTLVSAGGGPRRRADDAAQ